MGWYYKPLRTKCLLNSWYCFIVHNQGVITIISKKKKLFTLRGLVNGFSFSAVTVVVESQLLAIFIQSFSGVIGLPLLPTILTFVWGTCVSEIHFMFHFGQWLVGFAVHLLHLWFNRLKVMKTNNWDALRKQSWKKKNNNNNSFQTCCILLYIGPKGPILLFIFKYIY